MQYGRPKGIEISPSIELYALDKYHMADVGWRGGNSLEKRHQRSTNLQDLALAMVVYTLEFQWACLPEKEIKGGPTQSRKTKKRYLE